MQDSASHSSEPYLAFGLTRSLNFVYVWFAESAELAKDTLGATPQLRRKDPEAKTQKKALDRFFSTVRNTYN